MKGIGSRGKKKLPLSTKEEKELVERIDEIFDKVGTLNTGRETIAKHKTKGWLSKEKEILRYKPTFNVEEVQNGELLSYSSIISKRFVKRSMINSTFFRGDKGEYGVSFEKDYKNTNLKMIRPAGEQEPDPFTSMQKTKLWTSLHEANRLINRAETDQNYN